MENKDGQATYDATLAAMRQANAERRAQFWRTAGRVAFWVVSVAVIVILFAALVRAA